MQIGADPTPNYTNLNVTDDVHRDRHNYISQFIQKIVVEINILRKLLELRRAFQELVEADADLELVEAATVQTVMIGLGAFRFVPSCFKAEVESESVHLLNKYLCDELNEAQLNVNAGQHKTRTQIYKLSMDHQGTVCIVVNPTNLVFKDNCADTICAQICDSHRRMSASFKDGIDLVKKVVDLQAGADYTVDSIVRKVPLFGSVYGWLLPDGQDLDDDSDYNTGVGFQIGVGVTKPQIQ